MTVHLSCDYCGEPIHDDAHVRLKVDGQSHAASVRRTIFSSVGHYHASADRDCWAEMLERIQVIHEVSGDLDLADETLARRHEEQHRLAEEESVRQDEQWARARSWAEHAEEIGRQRRAWRQTPQEAKLHWILNVIGSESISMGEIAERMAAAHSDLSIYITHVTPLVMKLLERGDLERQATGGTGPRPKWLYRRPKPSTTVEALERALQVQEDAA